MSRMMGGDDPGSADDVPPNAERIFEKGIGRRPILTVRLVG